MNTFMDGVMLQPLWLKAWLGWMILVNSASLVFLSHKEARIILGLWIANAITMTVFAELFGYTRILGLSHVIWWTPLLIYLFTRRKQIDYAKAFGKWIIVLLVTNSASLIIDYIDVFRYILGERDPTI